MLGLYFLKRTSRSSKIEDVLRVVVRDWATTEVPVSHYFVRLNDGWTNQSRIVYRPTDWATDVKVAVGVQIYTDIWSVVSSNTGLRLSCHGFKMKPTTNYNAVIVPTSRPKWSLMNRLAIFGMMRCCCKRWRSLFQREFDATLSVWQTSCMKTDSSKRLTWSEVTPDGDYVRFLIDMADVDLQHRTDDSSLGSYCGRVCRAADLAHRCAGTQPWDFRPAHTYAAFVTSCKLTDECWSHMLRCKPVWMQNQDAKRAEREFLKLRYGTTYPERSLPITSRRCAHCCGAATQKFETLWRRASRATCFLPRIFRWCIARVRASFCSPGA